MNDYVRRRHPGQWQSPARVITARANGWCDGCENRIKRGRDKIILHFDRQKWVHIHCLDKVQ